MRIKTRITALMMTLVMFTSLSAPALAESATAATIQLKKTEGTVSVSKSNGKGLSLRSGMRLYNGYNVTTEAGSYAWINLDSTKLIKEDASSGVEVRKNGKKLEVNVSYGSVFFNISEDLSSDENLNISTSTMVVGIRGTSGWLRVIDRGQAEVCVLEGTTQCVVSDPVTGETKSATLQSGDVAKCVTYSQEQEGDKCDILMGKATLDDIPGHVIDELVGNVALCDEILEKSGMDVLAELAREAGGPPSGRSADGKSASPEVRREADRRQSQDEDTAKRETDAVQKEAAKQDSSISQEPVWEPDKQPGAPSEGSPGSSGDTSEPDPPEPDPPTPPAPVIYTVSFSGGGTVASQTTGADHKLSSIPEAIRPLLGDAAFDGWYTSETGGTKITTDYVFSEDTTVYARWTGGSWTLNEDTGLLTVYSDAAMAGNVVPWGMSLDGGKHLANIKTVELRSGVTRVGAAAFTDCVNLTSMELPGTVTVIGPGALSATLKTVKFGGTVAQWAGIDGLGYLPAGITAVTCTDGTLPATVTFDANGGTVTAATAVAGLDGRLAGLPTPTRAGFIFAGWYTGKTDGAEVGASDVFFRNTTVYAHWDTPAPPPPPPPPPAPTTYTVSFSGGGTVASQTTGTNHKLSNIPGPASTMLGDATFDGWYTSQTGGTKITTDYVFSGNTTVYARWTGGSWMLNEDTGLLTVFNDTAMTGSGVPWGISLDGGSHLTNIRTVEIQSGVTTIGTNAFSDCGNLTSVSIPDSVSEVGQSAFYNCQKLASIKIPSGVKQIVSMAFFGSGLTSIELPSSLTGIGYDAFGSNALETITFGGTVKEWANINGLEYLPATVTTVTCTDGTLPATVTFDAGGVSLGFTTAKTGLDGKLASLPTPTLTGANFEGWFTDPTNGTKIETDSVFSGNTTIYAQWDTSSGWTFNETTGLLTVSDNAAMAGGSIPWEANKTGIQTVDIRSGVTTIGTSAFSDCVNLTSIAIPSGVTTIGMSAFNRCTSLKNVTIPETVKTIDYGAFSGCSALTSINIPNGVTTIGEGAFNYTGLKSVVIPDSVTTIGYRVFVGCSGLTSVTIGKKVTKISDEMFSGCTNLKNIELPDNVTGIGNYAFQNSGLTSITIPDTMTDIGTSAFQGCTSLTSITVPGMKKIGEKTIGVDRIAPNVFSGCTSLATVVIGTGVEYIDNDAFKDCTGLTNLTIPNTAIYFLDNSLKDSASLTNITFIGTEAEWNSSFQTYFPGFSKENEAKKLIFIAPNAGGSETTP